MVTMTLRVSVLARKEAAGRGFGALGRPRQSTTTRVSPIQ